MAIPVDADWKRLLLREIYPLLESADNTGVINQWYFNWKYQRGPILEFFLEADSTAVHTILRPMLQERFGDLQVAMHDDEMLDTLTPQFDIGPADIDEDCLTDVHVIGTQLMASHGQHCLTCLGQCHTEVTTALNGVKNGEEWVSAFAKTQLGIWLDQYLDNRYSSRQMKERQAQEIELLDFLRQQTPIEVQVMIGTNKTKWIEGFQELEDQYDGEKHISNALNEHIKRYGLSSFQVGQIWLSNISLEHRESTLLLKQISSTH